VPKVDLLQAARVLPIDAVLFDLDGTLADSAPDLTAALNHVRRDRGLHPVPVSAVRPHASSGARGMLGAGMGVTPDAPDFDALRESFLAYYAQCLTESTALFDGVAALLDDIEARGLLWGIVTNKAQRFTSPVVAALQLAMRAGTIISGDSTPHAKPHPAPLLRAAEELRISPLRCIYVGDDLRDVIAGNAAGMATIVANYGYQGPDESTAHWPAVGWIDEPSALVRWLPDRRPATA
jgi:phosphoglycolate phosphatase